MGIRVASGRCVRIGVSDGGWCEAIWVGGCVGVGDGLGRVCLKAIGFYR